MNKIEDLLPLFAVDEEMGIEERDTDFAFSMRKYVKHDDEIILNHRIIDKDKDIHPDDPEGRIQILSGLNQRSIDSRDEDRLSNILIGDSKEEVYLSYDSIHDDSHITVYPWNSNNISMEKNLNLDGSSHSYSYLNTNLLNSIKEIYIQSNSPLSMSENNSDDDLDYDADAYDNKYDGMDVHDDIGIKHNEEIDYRLLHDQYVSDLNHDKQHKQKLLFNDSYNNILDKYYEHDDKYSSNLDILITYTRCQKSIYLKSRNITEANLYLFMIPTIILGIFISILAPEISSYKWGGGVISGLNILMTALISLSNYLKLESKTEIFSQLAKQYDKIEISLEMANNKLLFLDSEQEKNQLILHKLNDIEIKLNELAEINSVNIPDIIKQYFPIICHINIFSLIKKLEIYKKTLIHKFINVKQEIRYILNKWKRVDNKNSMEIDKKKERTRLLFLYNVKEKLKTELVEYNHVYNFIDEYFTKEIAQAESISHFWILFSSWFSHKSTFNKLDVSKKNHIIDKYFRFVFDD